MKRLHFSFGRLYTCVYGSFRFWGVCIGRLDIGIHWIVVRNNIVSATVTQEESGYGVDGRIVWGRP